MNLNVKLKLRVTKHPEPYRQVTAVRTLPIIAIVALYLSQPDGAQAACVFTPTAGDDQHQCDSGTATDLIDTLGNNTLTFPAGGTGGVLSDVTFGNGNDTISMGSGLVGGSVDQGGGDDTFVIVDGTVSGDVRQGDGADNFRMSGGTINRLFQGDNIDFFEMSGGHIVDAFEDGDIATMTGGRIGRVDMKLDDNVFNMSGGQIDRNLVTGFGDDTITLSNGTIGGNISVSGGTDSVTIKGGRVGGNVTMSFGNDLFVWDGGGEILGLVDLGPDDDIAELSNLTSNNIGLTTQINGGDGTDELTLKNVQLSDPSRLQGWENVSFLNVTKVTFDSSLVLGDATSETGTLAIDETSHLLVGGANASVLAFSGQRFVEVINAGVIDLTSLDGDTSNTLTITGNYTGNGGRLLIDTVLGGDSSASDRLIINGGSATGNTLITVENVGGTGALTVQDGINVVEATGGANTGTGTFTLARPLAAGAYEYLLFKGGTASADAQNWYLRSALVNPVGPTPEEIIPLYRPEVPVYAVAGALARQSVRASLGTFHDRRGDQTLFGSHEDGSSWGRIYADHSNQSWKGTVSPDSVGSLYGFQGGVDLLDYYSADGHRDIVGIAASYSRTTADVKGFALGVQDAAAGKVNLGATSLGAYWSRFGRAGWYVDTNLVATLFNGDARSERGVGIDIDGYSIAVSVEAGYPIHISSDVVLEPQAQLIWQRIDLDDTADLFSSVAFDGSTSVAARLGARLSGKYQMNTGSFRPYLKANLWHDLGGSDSVTLSSDIISTEIGRTSIQLGLGAVYEVTDAVSAFAASDYSFEVGEGSLGSWQAKIGFRVEW